MVTDPATSRCSDRQAQAMSLARGQIVSVVQRSVDLGNVFFLTQTDWLQET
jgi:hypothetical protein